MSRFFKYLLLVVFSVFLSSQINASSTFFSIEKSSARAYHLADAGSKVVSSLDEILVNGKIPLNPAKNLPLNVDNKFHKWFDQLTLEELKVSYVR